MKYLGKGRTRIVYQIGNYVIKFPRPSNIFGGIKANLVELSLFIKNHKNPLLCPIIFAFPGVFNVMPRKTILTNIPKPTAFIERARLIVGVDLCAVNVGWEDGTPCIIDYGSPGLRTRGGSFIRTEGGLSNNHGWIE